MPAEVLPRGVSQADAPAYWFLNGLNVVLATSESTAGAYSMVHHTAPSGHATPYHLHHEEDEAFYVLGGEFTFICDGKKTILGPGGYVFLPRGIPHGIRCTGSTPSTMLILAMPGTGFAGPSRGATTTLASRPSGLSFGPVRTRAMKPYASGTNSQ